MSNSCEIASEVMEDIRPYALMIEECRELYAILTTPHIRVSGSFSLTYKGEHFCSKYEGKGETKKSIR